MKKINIYILSSFLLFSITAFSQAPKKIIVEHFTNSNCGSCGSRNPGFYSNLSNQPGVLHLAVHPSSPYASCLLYQQNATENDARTNYYGIYGGTPRLVINGAVIPAGANYSSSSIFTPYQSQTTPANIRIVQEKLGSDSIHSTIIIKTEASHSLGGLSLFVALAEDTVFHTGTNGETRHYDVFRKSLTETSGIAVTLPAIVGDSISFSFSSASNSIWNFSRIYTLAILQETLSKNLVQVEAVSASDGTIILGINEEFASELLVNVFPNPVSNLVSINLTLSESSNLFIDLIDISGKQVAIISNEKQYGLVTKQLSTSTLSEGNYFVRIQVNGKTAMQKIMVKH